MAPFKIHIKYLTYAVKDMIQNFFLNIQREKVIDIHCHIALKWKITIMTALHSWRFESYQFSIQGLHWGLFHFSIRYTQLFQSVSCMKAVDANSKQNIQCGAVIMRSIFSKIIHKRACPLGRGMGCLLWIQRLIDILSQFLQLFMQYLTILDRILTALNCISKGLTHWGLVIPYRVMELGQHWKLVNTGYDNGLLPDGIKWVPEPMLTYH